MATLSNGTSPRYDTVTEVRFESTGSTRVCWVAASDAKRLVLAAPPAVSTSTRAPRRGDRARVTWTDHTEGVRTLPVELLGVQQELVPLWHFRRTGPAVAAQRRTSVRVDLHVPVQVTHGGHILVGTTVDLSEGGVQCSVLATAQALPPIGGEVSVALLLDGDKDTLRARGELVRSSAGVTNRRLLTVRFLRLDEQRLDRLRSRVFLELRHQRAEDLD
jgi:c-di-GMP-binding flagellar brake protein YcgR